MNDLLSIALYISRALVNPQQAFISGSSTLDGTDTSPNLSLLSRCCMCGPTAVSMEASGTSSSRPEGLMMLQLMHIMNIPVRFEAAFVLQSSPLFRYASHALSFFLQERL